MGWNRNNRIEQEYKRALTSIYGSIIEVVKHERDINTLEHSLHIISNTPEFHDYSLAVASKMATQVNTASAASWREAARQVGRGNDLYQAIMRSLQEDGTEFHRLVRDNAKLIRSVPDEAADWIVQRVQEESLKGRRAADIQDDILLQYPDMMYNQAKTLARTEVSKIQSALTEHRALDLGLPWYVWRTAKDARRRSSHAFMEGVLINWNNPPDPESLAPQKMASYGSYHAGCIFNCRCYAEVIVDIAFVDFPAQVYHNGRIQSMNKSQFEKLDA